MATCKHVENSVIDSRPGELGIRRRRQCDDCGVRWTTMEVEVEEFARDFDIRADALVKLKARIKRDMCHDIAKTIIERGNGYVV